MPLDDVAGTKRMIIEQDVRRYLCPDDDRVDSDHALHPWRRQAVGPALYLRKMPSFTAVACGTCGTHSQ
eukprot:1901932-Prymnesium_polylepis.1